MGDVVRKHQGVDPPPIPVDGRLCPPDHAYGPMPLLKPSFECCSVGLRESTRADSRTNLEEFFLSLRLGPETRTTHLASGRSGPTCVHDEAPESLPSLGVIRVHAAL